MPLRAPVICSYPGCGTLTLAARCERHAGIEKRASDARRPNAHARGYDTRWRKLRRLILTRDPICWHCHRAPSTDVDHIVPRRRGGSDDEDNLQGLCHRCHSAKTAREDGRWG